MAKPFYVYVVRYENRIDGEEDSGVFETCHRTRAEARKALKRDYDSTKKLWPEELDNDETLKSREAPDYASLEVERHNSYDYRSWWVERLKLDGGRNDGKR